MISKKIVIFLTIIFTIFSPSGATNFDLPMNFITCCDNEHFDWLPGLFKSIRQWNPKKEIRIIVFDIGMLPEQVDQLIKEHNVQVEAIEMTNPDLLKKFVVRPNGRLARGWYAWKPVAFHQALTKFDYFVHIDAGKRIAGPCDILFCKLLQDGYFFFDCGHTIRPMATQYVVDKFKLDETILDQFGIEAGFQGITRKIAETYVEPMYRLAFDLTNFQDDGSAPWGFGGGRHDQTLFSIIGQQAGFTIHRADGPGPREIALGNIKIPFRPNMFVTFKDYAENPHATLYKLL